MSLMGYIQFPTRGELYPYRNIGGGPARPASSVGLGGFLVVCLDHLLCHVSWHFLVVI
jgi:hypothetical protein